MNRLVLIGNGFDLAHGLKTSYADFINWYWDKRVIKMSKTYARESKDNLCSFKYLGQGHLFSFFFDHPAVSKEKGFGKECIESIINSNIFETKISTFFKNICTSIETKGWVDIENEYYRLLEQYALPISITPNKDDIFKNITFLNEQLEYLKGLLVTYLKELAAQQYDMIDSIRAAIYAPFDEKDMSIDGVKCLNEHKEYWENQDRVNSIEEKIDRYGLNYQDAMDWVNLYHNTAIKRINNYPYAFLLPDDIMFLNFNYTNTAKKYLAKNDPNHDNHIHGQISNQESVIFGYGDELDENFKKLQELNENECLHNVKSIRYLENPNYKDVLRFIESAPFQVLIMGHSCGKSDRTLLNTIFEHKNCISIKPYYYKKEDETDNYIELIQNISRNFTDMKLMRDRVVNKTQCKPLVKE